MAMLNNQMVTVRVPNSGIWIALMTGSSIMKKGPFKIHRLCTSNLSAYVVLNNNNQNISKPMALWWFCCYLFPLAISLYTLMN